MPGVVVLVQSLAVVARHHHEGPRPFLSALERVDQATEVVIHEVDLVVVAIVVTNHLVAVGAPGGEVFVRFQVVLEGCIDRELLRYRWARSLYVRVEVVNP